MTWVVWNTNGAVMKVPIEEENGFIDEEEEDEEETASRPVVNTFAGYAREVSTAAAVMAENFMTMIRNGQSCGHTGIGSGDGRKNVYHLLPGVPRK